MKMLYDFSFAEKGFDSRPALEEKGYWAADSFRLREDRHLYAESPWARVNYMHI